jgi:hypothetical protein
LSTKLILSAVAAIAAFGAPTAPTAAAQPAGFPDLNQFTAVDAGPYVRPFSYAERWANGYLFFRTADGISCAIGGSSWCTGDLPGRPDQPAGCGNVQSDGGDATRPFVFGSKEGPCVPSTDPVLGAGQKVTNAAFGITCAAGSDGLTACIDTRQEHGFVLQPSGSWVF